MVDRSADDWTGAKPADGCRRTVGGALAGARSGTADRMAGPGPTVGGRSIGALQGPPDGGCQAADEERPPAERRNQPPTVHAIPFQLRSAEVMRRCAGIWKGAQDGQTKRTLSI